MHEIPSLSFSYFPMNLDLLYMIPLYFGNDIAPKLIHFTFALLTAWLVFGFLRSRTNTSYALLGVAFFLSIPIIVKLSITAYVDLGLLSFSTASLLLLIKWRENRFQIRYLVFSAIFCGLAMGTKYNGLITFFLLSLFILFLSGRVNRGEPHGIMKTIVYGCVFLTVAGIIFSPWMIRDYVWTGNPIYPLYDQWFNPDHVARKSIGLFTYRALVYHESWGEMLLLPIRIFFQGQDGNPQFFDGKLNPFLLVFSVLAFYQLRKDSEKIKTEKKILLAFSALYFAFAFFSSGLRIRYIAPIIPPLVILTVFGMKRLFDSLDEIRSIPFKKGMELVAACLVLLAISLNARYVYGQFGYVKPLTYLFGNISRDGYIEKYRPEFPAMKYINGHLPLDAKILFVFIGNRGYYCDRKYVFDMQGNRSRIARLLKSAHSARAVWEGLKRDGITHVLINMGLFAKWASQSFRASDLTQMKSFFNEHMHLLYHKNGYGVFVLAGKRLSEP
ncbi:MAG: glycosyltransferase family 39 protein [Deltaproteobacteria bacterium]|nr:glycosyltransferase family 39 protein [Deltaproteobacteria bacterium]